MELLTIFIDHNNGIIDNSDGIIDLLVDHVDDIICHIDSIGLVDEIIDYIAGIYFHRYLFIIA